MSVQSANVAIAKCESREINMAKVECDWCYGTPAAWKINDVHSLDGYANACTAHGTEWYPHLFPESDVTPIEEIIASIPVQPEPKIRFSPVGVTRNTPRPWYPLVGHRSGLRMNDLVTLASAFAILKLEGGTAHL